MAKFDFDGPNKRIIMHNDSVVNGVATFTVAELWSEWCDWMLLDDNLKYHPALDVLMVPLNATEFVGPYLFMRNDLGWIGVPPEVNPCTVIIDGSFFGSDPMLPVMANHTAQATNLVINRSTLTSTMVTSGVAGPSANDIAAATLALFVSNQAFRQAMAEDVWNYTDRTITSASSSSLTTEEHNKLMSIPTADEFAVAQSARVIENNLTNEDLAKLTASVLLGKVTGAGTGTERFRNLADTKDRVIANIDASGNRTLIALDPA